MESQAKIKMSSPVSEELEERMKPSKVIERLDAILNSKSEPFEKKVQSLVEVWKSVSELDFSKFRIQNLIKIVDWAKLHALDIVLNGKWGKTKECFCDNLLKYIEKAQAGLASCSSAFSSRCQKLADVVRRPWEHPVLNKLINNKDAQIGPEEIEFFCVETIYLVSVRLKKLCENRCEDLALNLSTNYLKYKKQATLRNMNLNATDTQLWFIFDIHIALLYKFQDKHNIIKEFKELPLEDGVQLIRRFTRKRVKIAKIWCDFENIAIFGCKFFLAEAMTCDGDENLKEVQRYLLKTFFTLSNTDTLLDNFILTARNFTKLADAEGLFVMCEVIHRECSGAKMFHFAIEMYIRAITTDMNEMERLKDTSDVDKIRHTTARLAQSFEYLGDLLDHELKVARETVLTAFSIYPTKHRLNRIIDLARRSGYEVLDTGQEEWKCRLHPPVIPSDDILWICPECGEWMCEPVLTAPIRVNIPLQEALQECLLDIPLTVRDDLVVCLSNPRYRILSWVLAWNDLHRLCIFYLNDPEKTKNFVTELKFIKPDYSKFDNIKREPMDEYPGIEKGYEQYLDLDFNPEEEKSTARSTVSDSESIFQEGSDENGDHYPLSPTTSNPNTLKSLRMYRPNLKRKNIDAKIPIQETKVAEATQRPSDSKVARISPYNSNLPTLGYSNGYESDSSLVTSISQSVASRTESRDSVVSVPNLCKKIKLGENSSQSFASTSHTALDTIFNDSIDEIQSETQPDINNSKNAMAATLPQLGGHVAQKQLSQVPYQPLPDRGGHVAQKQLSQVPYRHQPQRVNQKKIHMASLHPSKLKPTNFSESGKLIGNAFDHPERKDAGLLGRPYRGWAALSKTSQDNQLAEQMKELMVRIIPLECSQLPTRKTLATKQKLIRVPAPSVMKPTNCSVSDSLYPTGTSSDRVEKKNAWIFGTLCRGEASLLESNQDNQLTAQMKELVVRIIPLQGSQLHTRKTLATKQNLTRVPAPSIMKPGFPQNLIESPPPAKELVILLQKVPDVEALLAAKSKKSSMESKKPSEVDCFLPTANLTATCSTELNSLLRTPNSIATSKTELDVPMAFKAAPLLAAISPIISTTELNTLLATPELTTSQTEVDLLCSEDPTITEMDLTTPDLKNLTISLTQVDLLETTLELVEKAASTTELSVPNMTATKLGNLATSSTGVDLLTTPTTEVDQQTTPTTVLDLIPPSQLRHTSHFTNNCFPILSATTSQLCTQALTLTSDSIETLSTETSTQTPESFTTPESLDTCTTEAKLLTEDLYPLQTETLATCTTTEIVETCTRPQPTLLTEDPYPPHLETLAICTTSESLKTSSTAEATLLKNDLCPPHPKTLTTCLTPQATLLTKDPYPPHPETLATCTTPEPLATFTTAEALETCSIPEATLLTGDPYPPQAPVRVQLGTTPKLLSYHQESATAVVYPSHSVLLSRVRLISQDILKMLLPGATINQGVCRASVKLEQIQKAPIMAQKVCGKHIGPHQVVVSDKDEVLECHDIQSTKNEQDMAREKIVTNNKTVSVTIINEADNCSTINNVYTNLSCDNDTNEVPLNDTDSFTSDCSDDLDEDTLERFEIQVIFVEELDFPLSDAAVATENVDADIITENITSIDFTCTDDTPAVLKDIPNSQETMREYIPQDYLPLDHYSTTRDPAQTTSEIKVNNLPKYSQAEDKKCLNQYKSHQKFPKTDILVQRLESSFGFWDSCNFNKKPKIENIASAIDDNYIRTNKDFQSNISVFPKDRNDRNVRLQLSSDDASESWIPWKWQKSNLKMYSNNRKRKYDGVPCFKLDNEEKDCRPFSVDLQRSTKQISSPKANVIIENQEYCKPPIVLNKYVKKTPFCDFTNLNEVELKRNSYGRIAHQRYKLVQKPPESQPPPRILNSEISNFIRRVPGLHDYSEISPTNMTHVVNVVEHGEPRSSTVTNTNTQTSTQVTPHIQRIGQAKLDRKPDHYDVDPEPSSSTVMSAPSTSQSTLINIFSSPKTSQKSTQPRPTPMVNILSQQIYMPSLDPHQELEVLAPLLFW